VNGTGFYNGSVVRWNGSSLTTTYVSGTQVTASVPAANIASAGTASGTVFNASPGGGTSNAVTFTINSAAKLPSVQTDAADNVTATSGDMHGEIFQDGAPYTV